MIGYPTNIYLQPIAIQSNSEPPENLNGNESASPSLATYAHVIQLSSSGSPLANDISTFENRIVKPIFSNVPALSQSELVSEYRELGEALNNMTMLDDGDEWKIEAAVYDAARFIAVGLMANAFPAPRIFTHGPESVVFNWSRERDNLYLTISADSVSALISSPERIKRRVDYSAIDFMNSAKALPSIRAIHSDEPVVFGITGSVSGPPDFEH